ncbi:MAG: NAD(P)-binding protein [Salinisphaera sp.]|jgi:renalase|nr:NAD(P)-binding protein [Salinisphaera sp.]
MTDFLIIGAGVAGMAAASTLTAAGAEVRLIDKAARPGGRCATRRVAPASDAAWFDYGAQYFTARDDAFRAWVERDIEHGRLARWRPAVAQAEKTGSTWLLTPSPDERERLIGPRGLNRWVRDCLGSLDAPVECGVRATSVQRRDMVWHVETDHGDRLLASQLLLTVPAVQAAALLGPQAGRITALANAERALSACHSLVVSAPALGDAQAIFIKDGALSWAADNSHKAGTTAVGEPHLWTLHASPNYSDHNVETPTAELAPALIDEFAAITAQRSDDIQLVRAHRWRYARPGPAAPDAETQSWYDKAQGLALAGDWLAGGRVEGAWLSGRAAARHILEQRAAD